MSFSKSFLILLPAFFLIGACTPSGDQAAPQVSGGPEIQQVILTDSQIKAAGIQIGHVEEHVVSVSIPATGVLDVPPQSRVSVNPPMGGFVRKTELLEGMKVQKGQVLAVLEHPDYIQLQQDYLDSRSQLTFLEQEMTRQQMLARENVNAAKALQQAEAQHGSMQAKANGLAARLGLIGLAPQKVLEGPLTSTIQILSPITGYVTDVNTNLGKYAGADQILFELVDTRHLHAELQIFESDLAKLRLNQRVWVKLLNESEEREASIYLIGREISPSRTVQVHCHFKVHDEHLVPGMYFSARVETGQEKKQVLPSEAAVHHEGKYCVFVRTAEGAFRLTEISASDPVAGYIAVSGLEPEADIVVKGSFHLLSSMRSGDDE